MKTTLERFWPKVHKRENGCWLWLASKRGYGYGQFYDGITIVDAHRFSYKEFVGEIPPGNVVMHTCDNPSCVRPDHLTTGTQKQNLQDMYKKGRNRSIDTYPQQSGENHWMHRKTNNA